MTKKKPKRIPEIDCREVCKARHKANLTITEAANKAGLGVQHWRNIEVGLRAHISPHTLQRMAMALGVTMEYLLTPLPKPAKK